MSRPGRPTPITPPARPVRVASWYGTSPLKSNGDAGIGDEDDSECVASGAGKQLFYSQLPAPCSLLTRPVAVEMLDRCLVSPGDLFNGDAEDGGDFLSFGRAGCPAAQRDGRDAAVVEAAAPGELGDARLLFLAEVGDSFDHGTRVASDAAKSASGATVGNGLGFGDGLVRTHCWQLYLTIV